MVVNELDTKEGAEEWPRWVYFERGRGGYLLLRFVRQVSR
jgi:hypothetical protein